MTWMSYWKFWVLCHADMSFTKFSSNHSTTSQSHSPVFGYQTSALSNSSIALTKLSLNLVTLSWIELLIMIKPEKSPKFLLNPENFSQKPKNLPVREAGWGGVPARPVRWILPYFRLKGDFQLMPLAHVCRTVPSTVVRCGSTTKG